MEFEYIFLCILGLIASGSALECFVCSAQDSNKDKCVKTTIQCEEHQDTCLTRIEWRQPVYWTPRTERMFYIAKSCETEAFCQAEKGSKGVKCMRDWYRDWDCVECCQGDRCNYYATLGTGMTKASVLTVLLAMVVSVTLRLWR